MIDITKDEFWDTPKEEVVKKEWKTNTIKKFILNHKMLSASIVIFTVCICANIVLIYGFFRMIKFL